MAETALNNVQQDAQDLSNQTGATALTGYNPTSVTEQIGQNVTNKPTESYIDKATSTVAGQLTNLLGSDSPYIKQARAQALEGAQSRGLLNTTIAQQAGQTAAIQSALPIAQQDASVFAQGDLSRQQFDQSLGKQTAEYITQGALQQQGELSQSQQNALNRQHELALQGNNITSQRQIVELNIAAQERENIAQRSFQESMAAADRAQQVSILGLQNHYDVAMQELRGEQETALATMELNSQEASEVRLAASTIMQNYQQTMVSLLSDPTFLELSGADLNKTLENMKNVAKNQIKFLGAMSQVDLTSFIDSAFPSVTF